MGKHVKSHVINPKALTRVQLLGHINLDTRQWTDGVLTMKAQQVYSEPPGMLFLQSLIIGNSDSIFFFTST